ncbi:hypothetical protein EDM55_27510 [Brevibacillus centrosporus]|nr:hypothetical protein EDM55_27510 [Brevibacillus centrosporus]
MSLKTLITYFLSNFVGFAYYKQFLTDSRMWAALYNTLVLIPWSTKAKCLCTQSGVTARHFGQSYGR